MNINYLFKKVVQIILVIVLVVTLSVIVYNSQRERIAKEIVKKVAVTAFTANDEKELSENFNKIKPFMDKELHSFRFNLDSNFTRTWGYGKYKGFSIKSNVREVVAEKTKKRIKVRIAINVLAQNKDEYFNDVRIFDVYVKGFKITGWED